MLRGKLGIIAAAVAAYGIYKYSKMSAEEKNALKERGKEFLNKNLSGVGDLFGKKTTAANGNVS
ncbi:MAG: hypothetical protein ABWZ25_02500 [Chitinophagaceae bacterium]